MLIFMYLYYSGAIKVLTVEYAEIKSEFPGHSSLHPVAYAQAWLDGEVDEFDFAVSFSSHEHSGLGRYGDRINPFGDIEEFQRMSCSVKPLGLFFLAVPLGHDYLVWNSHRIYGPARLPLVTANWDILGVYSTSKVYNFEPIFGRPLSAEGHPHYTQPVIVLQNKRQEPCKSWQFENLFEKVHMYASVQDIGSLFLSCSSDV